MRVIFAFLLTNVNCFLLMLLLSSCNTCYHCSPISNSICSSPLSSFSFQRAKQESPYFLLILVNARGLDYSNLPHFLQSLAKHPRGGSKNSDTGHAWIYLQGFIQQRRSDGFYNFVPFKLEGGQSGEGGIHQPKYFEGIMNYSEYGYAAIPNANFSVKKPYRYEPNPIKYLFSTLNDGYFQQGSGGHRPTFAIKIPLSIRQFDEILAYIEQYDFSSYSLTQQQCCSFVQEIAQLADIYLETKITLLLPQALHLNRIAWQLWADPSYSQITFACPEKLEQSMKEAVRQGKATLALTEYQDYVPTSFNWLTFKQDLLLFPTRLQRLWLMKTCH